MRHIFKFRLRHLLIIAFLIECFSGCKKDDFLNVDNTNAVTSETVFSLPSAADLVLNDIYKSLPDMYCYPFFDAVDNWSDNAMSGFTWTVSSNALRTKANITPNTALNAGWDGAGKSDWIVWDVLYNKIRKCNLFIKGLDGTTDSTVFTRAYKNQRMGEVRTLRAYFYSQLWTNYGGVPLITVPDDRNSQGDSIFHKRASFDEIFQFLETELTTSAALLPPNSGNSGGARITYGAALTLKGWIELFYASPLNNTANDPARWAAAAATNKKVMQLGYTLHPKYDELFFATGNNNNEGIFYRQYIGNIYGSNLISLQGPTHIGLTWNSWGGSTPTQELVDDYAMANGKAITDAGSGYSEQDPYVGREPRFYQSILYNGNTIDGYPFYTAVGSGLTAIDLSDASDETNTGYATKKRMDTTVNAFQSGLSSQNYYFFRYAEVLLNYAEAQNEAAGPDASVYEALDMVRDRAGVPNFSTVYPAALKAEMRTLIRRERRIELAFEDKRYLDLIRWKIAETNLNHVMHGMKITGTTGNYTYTRIDAIPSGSPQWTFDAAKNYLFPIPTSAISKNKALTGHQNPGY